jgi:hypothetical protein
VPLRVSAQTDECSGSTRKPVVNQPSHGIHELLFRKLLAAAAPLCLGK